MIEQGSVYFLKDTEPSPHWHIVIFVDPLGADKRLIVCYLSSSCVKPDKTVTFKPNDDFFIDRDCWVKYRNAKIFTEQDLTSFNCKGRASNNTIEKIFEGLKKSFHRVPREVKNLYLSWEDNRLYAGVNKLHK